jgi:signal transduction histidine kinase
MRRASYVLKVVCLFVLYYASARWGLSFDPVSGFATLVWLPTGISLAAIFLYGYELFPAIVLGAFLANISTSASMSAAFGISIGNTLEALLGSYFLKQIGFRPMLERVRDVLDLIYVSVFATAISASIGVTSLYLNGAVTNQTFGDTWIAWWIGDALSALIITPLIFVWSSRTTSQKINASFVEIVGVLISLTLICFIVFRGVLGIIIRDSPVTYLTEPLLILIALRFTQHFVVTGVFLVTAIAIWGTISGLGPFAISDISTNLLSLQGYIGTMATTLMLFSAAISERRNAEMRKDHFIRMTAHELKNPITSLDLYAQLLQKSLLHTKYTSKDLKYITFIKTQNKRLTRLVDDLLDLSRISMDHLKMSPLWFDLNLLVSEITQTINLGHKGHTIVVKGKIKKRVWADKDRIGQVLFNILGNAIRYSPGENKVIVNLFTDKKKNICVSIQDFGMGIAKNEQDKIFDRFYQVDGNRSESSDGLGIGLYVSKKIIDLHKGKIWVESEIGKGSTFFFTIPVQSHP